MNIIFINGTMGVGKTATSRALQKMLPKCVFLDGDWCLDMSPFIVTEKTKQVIIDNIVFMLNNFIKSGEFKNIVFCWVMHYQSIMDEIISRVDIGENNLFEFTLVCDDNALTQRLSLDIQRGKRENDIISRSLLRQHYYDSMNTIKIDVSEISAEYAATLMYNEIVTPKVTVLKGE